MKQVRIDALLAGNGTPPANGFDPDSSAGYTEWLVNDQALFTLVIPEDYVPGHDLSVYLVESSASISMRHGWTVVSSLLRPGSNASPGETFTETIEYQFTGPAAAGRLMSAAVFRAAGALGPGTINNAAIAPGDAICIRLERSPADSLEDPSPIRIFDISVGMVVGQSSESSCSGRVGEIIDAVRDLFNDPAGGFLSDEFIVRSINRCMADLARDNYWRCETWIPAVSGVGSIDLAVAIPGFQDVHNVKFHGSGESMKHIGSFQDFQALESHADRGGPPVYYNVRNTIISVWPAPSENSASGFLRVPFISAAGSHLLFPESQPSRGQSP